MNWPYRRLPWPLHLVLWLFSLPFAWLARLRRLAFAQGWLASTRLAKPVISVGNLTWGGTGKSPLISWLVEECQKLGIKPAILTRGYKSQGRGLRRLGPGGNSPSPEEAGDEPWMLHLRHPDVPILIQADRADSGQVAAREADLLLLDDGMQHLQLQRNLDLCLIDHSRGLGNGLVMPCGPLREPARALAQASAVVVTKANLPAAPDLNQVLNLIPPGLPVFFTEYHPQSLVLAQTGKELPLTWLQEKEIHAFSGLGNNAGFAATLSGLGLPLASHLVLPDHGSYATVMQQELAKKTGILLTTEKDFARLQGQLANWPAFYWLKMAVQIPPDFAAWLELRLKEIAHV